MPPPKSAPSSLLKRRTEFQVVCVKRMEESREPCEHENDCVSLLIPSKKHLTFCELRITIVDNDYRRNVVKNLSLVKVERESEMRRTRESRRLRSYLAH